MCFSNFDLLYSRFTYNRTVLLIVLFSLPSLSIPFVAWHAYFPAAASFTDCKTKLPNWLYCITRLANLLFPFSPFLSASSVRLFSASCISRAPYYCNLNTITLSQTYIRDQYNVSYTIDPNKNIILSKQFYLRPHLRGRVILSQTCCVFMGVFS